MKSQPITPARIDWADETPAAPDFGDIYRPRAGRYEQARHVFLHGNGLPVRWRGRERFVMLETGFGLGHNFVATWDAWRTDAQRCRQLVFASVERHPPQPEDLRRAHAGGPLAALADTLAAHWPPLVHGLHPLDFEGGRLRLLLAFGDVADWLPELVLRADALLLDGFAPARNPAMWDPRVLKALGRRAAPGATAATWSVARGVAEGLVTAGFEVQRAPGIGGKREITVARHAPRRAAAAAAADGPSAGETPAGAPWAAVPRQAVVLGAGLAGAAVAQALAAEGWQVEVLDRHPAPAAETSGNRAGLFHGTVHADDGPHARWLRAAALFAQRALLPLLAAGVPGAADGLLRLAGRDLAGPQRWLDRQALPPDWAQVLPPQAASARAGLALHEAAWWYPSGGWVSPGPLVRAWLARRGVSFCGGIAVDRVVAGDAGWRLLDAEGRVLRETPTLVLANAADALRLLAPWGLAVPARRVRGQVSAWDHAPSALQRPLAGDGYAIALPGGGLLCGATSQPGDEDPAERDADHAHNLERLRRLTGFVPPHPPDEGRVGWRLQTEDRLPVAGPVPRAGARAEALRRWPREPGLWVATGLGGRGITLAPLLGRLLAAQVSGAPWPVEASLAEAVDPARWTLRAQRREGAASVPGAPGGGDAPGRPQAPGKAGERAGQG